MKPPACVRSKWGSGTTCEKQPDTVAAKEVKSNFEKMMAERAKQDSEWYAEPSPPVDLKKQIKVGQTNTASSLSNGLGNT
jgi:hypothetical protein